ncbi:MAG: ACT domain-containing protein [Clostridia bacterium]|nr:ACT domain-containing protein [Clostridia bacterium]
MQAVISVMGKDSIGIIAKASNKCAEHDVNIVDVSQTILQDYFVMIMLVDIDNINIPFSEFVDIMTEMGKKNNLEIHTMHEDIFNSMHRI